MLPSKTTLAIVTFAVLVFALNVAGLVPRFVAGAVIDFRPRQTAVAETQAPTLPIAPSRSMRKTTAAVAPNLIDEHESLKAFYQALWRTEAKLPGAVTRVLHYGDSPVTADSITADMRSLLQEHFGDAGHGFVLIAKPWAWYGHRGVELSGKGWHMAPATQAHAKDGLHGLGGVSFQGSAGATSRIVLKEDHNRVEIEYLAQPSGGVLEIRAAGQTIAKINTAAEEKRSGFESVELPAGARDIELVVADGSVRLFGVSFERSQPGVIYNSLGLNGGQVQVVVRYFDKGQWAEQLQHQRPDLVVLNYGTNESIFAKYIDHEYAGELREVIQRVKAAVPNASVLVMSPMDRGERDSTGKIVTVPILPHIVEIQERIAAETGCAFFNTFQAMGGEGTMARWYENQPRLVSADFMHPLPGGARKVGVLLDQALETGFRQYQAKHRGKVARGVSPHAGARP